MTNYEIQLLKMGQCDVMGPEVYWMSHWTDWVQLYFWMVVIRGNGKTAIINTQVIFRISFDIFQLSFRKREVDDFKCELTNVK